MSLRLTVLGAALSTALACTASAVSWGQDAPDLQPGVQTSSPGSWSNSAPAKAPAGSAESAASQATSRPAATATIPHPAPAPAPAPAGAAAHHSAAPPMAAHATQERAGSQADRLQLGTTEISGNRELPKQMYIVPWQRPQMGPFTGRPPNSLVDEALTPVDRTVFERQNSYYAALESGSPKAPATSASSDNATGSGAPPALARQPAVTKAPAAASPPPSGAGAAGQDEK